MNRIPLAQDTLTGVPLAEGLRDFFGPLFFVLLAIVAIFYLFKAQLTAFFQLVILGIGVSILLYRPDVIRELGEAVAMLLPGS